MNHEIEKITKELKAVLEGEPWYGKAVYTLLSEVQIRFQYKQPAPGSHSLVDLLYHMVTWAEFAQHRIEGEPISDMAAFDASDWRTIDPAKHDWQKGVAALKASHQQIIALLATKDDAFLNEKVDYREYDFRYLLSGLIQHNIYHLGQIAYVNKLFA